MSLPTSGPTPALTVLRTVIVGLAGGIVLIGVAFAFIVPVVAPPPVAVVALVALGVVAHLAISAFGYRVEPLPTGMPAAEARARAGTTFQARLIVRAVLSEATALVGIVLAFVVPPSSRFTYVVGALVALALIALHAWPTRRSVERVAVALEAQGTPSGLRETLGFPPGDLLRPPGFEEFS